MRHLFRFTYYRRIQISFLVLILLPTIMVAFLNYSTTNRQVKEKLMLSNDNILAVMSKDISKMMDDLTFASHFFVQDVSVRNTLRIFSNVERIENGSHLEQYKLIKDFFSLVAAKTMNNEIFMYLVNDAGFIVQAYDMYPTPEQVMKQWESVKSRVDESEPKQIQWLGMVQSGSDKTYYLSRVIRDPVDNKLLATLFIGLPEVYFKKLFQQVSTEHLALFDAGGQRIAGAVNIPYERTSEANRNIRNEVLIKKAGWKLVYETPESELTGELSKTFYLSLLLMLPFFLLFSIISIVVAKRLHYPILRLQRSIKQFGKGNRTITFPEDGKDEIAELGKTLNGMVEQIDKLIIDIEQEQEQKRVLELQALYAQIRPHFLLNTLNSIKCNLSLSDDQVHTRLIESLMSLLRAYMKMAEPLSLRSECKLLGDYVEIMKMRSDLSLNLDIRVAPECAELEIPKLLLQPIVENVFVHGFAENTNSNPSINIVAHQISNQVEILISDNGGGIPLNEREELNLLLKGGSTEDQASYKRIGLLNVLQRMRLTFGTDAAMHLLANDDGGTTVCVRIPILS
ncbi:sensor histidine kinase [Paenibacillus radicis (ex Xue et al. 2023)]|uniref:Histidine kinase n=1 Tax=Paenibacillus radicis (ex Xue et al. 2023) TaxID=2972489 RepID=A0ABT1YIB2_9BACL|nr:histidine kinase [Paenibacillus radicis (ex Xue et al. 2023)]MCR8632919.1 histidine kinase [Paenibacillus radicis (ex Xue et al. 2023)]